MAFDPSFYIKWCKTLNISTPAMQNTIKAYYLLSRKQNYTDLLWFSLQVDFCLVINRTIQ